MGNIKMKVEPLCLYVLNTIVDILEKENLDLDFDDWIINTYAD